MPIDNPQSPTPDTATGLEDYLGQQVVIDTLSTFIYIGKLIGIHNHYITLEAVDAHDTTDSASTKDHYIMEAHKIGVRTNRGSVKVRNAVIISVSRLEDIETW